MIINEAMRANLMPHANEIRNGTATLDTIKE
jgi:hypothetical protein